MRLHIAAVGKLKSGPEKLMAEDYAARIPALGKKAGVSALTVRDWAESQKPDVAARMAEEEALLWSAAPAGAYVIALDERGKAPTSQDFAEKLRLLADRGQHDIVFMLGGPDGHSENTRRKAGELLALGPMTWPHRLARIMLLEQIYRSVTILVNHPYHRA
ncbi:MAG: 23S rRNA (pseudouridine(1915)-N(3))-methyltransferase RlmH [Alphaproteobacteria bacterium]|nr:23S rRNA (pseudouridine(1915)-N(3))-methyltransferase RlmH [Alphaproteobacteria bacterium]